MQPIAKKDPVAQARNFDRRHGGQLGSIGRRKTLGRPVRHPLAHIVFEVILESIDALPGPIAGAPVAATRLGMLLRLRFAARVMRLARIARSGFMRFLVAGHGGLLCVHHGRPGGRAPYGIMVQSLADLASGMGPDGPASHLRRRAHDVGVP